uniref:Uncharacterized protein n=1 Tax=Human betaherpesvirus 6 TaxID=10368 RepID=A0A5P9U7U3_9BETA|nr:hypothetical protein [Human betaherpesvirus 6]
MLMGAGEENRRRFFDSEEMYLGKLGYQHSWCRRFPGQRRIDEMGLADSTVLGW